MIPRAYITEWRYTAPWPDDSLVELDLLLSRVLIEMFSDDLLANQLVFRGGTALHKLFVNPPGRFSEDIDLVQIEAGPIGRIMTAIRNQLDGWLGTPRTKQGHGRVTLLYRFYSEFEPAGLRRLKLEINTREHFSVFGIQQKPYGIRSRWFTGNAPVTVYHLDELLGTKLRALYQRKKGRDLFDLSLALNRADADPDRIVSCFLEYMKHGGTSVSRAEFEANLHLKLKDRAFICDIEPLLAHGIDWNQESAVQYVFDSLLTRLPGDPWKGRLSR